METSELAQRFFGALASGGLTWLNALVVGLLILVVAALRAGLKRVHPFFDSPGGVILINVVVSGLTATALALLGGTSFTLAILAAALVASWKAAGGFALLKHLLPLIPGLTDLLLKLPFVAALFPPKADGPTLVAEAQKIGLAAAVNAKAPTTEDLAK